MISLSNRDIHYDAMVLLDYMPIRTIRAELEKITKANNYVSVDSDKYKVLSKAMNLKSDIPYGSIGAEAEQSLYDLYEYMGQFPDDLNLAVMYERIKEMNLGYESN